MDGLPAQNAGSLWVRGYSPDGFQVSFTIPIVSVEDGMQQLERVRANGILPQMPGEEPGEKSETITTVVRREYVDKQGKVTPVIDFYPEWKGDYGEFRFAGVYLNTVDDIADFERASGVKLESLPLYESQAPVQRNPGRAHKCEVKTRPFVAVKVPDGEKEIGGKIQTVYKFSRFGGNLSGHQPPAETKGNPLSAEDVKAVYAYAKEKHLSGKEQTWQALRVSHINDYIGTLETAKADVSRYLKEDFRLADIPF